MMKPPIVLETGLLSQGTLGSLALAAACRCMRLQVRMGDETVWLTRAFRLQP